MASFGDVALNHNTNSRLTGTNNVGTMSFNANFYLHAVACTLHIMHSKNCNFDIEDTHIKSIKNTNTKIKGKKNDLNLENNQNFKMNGDSNTWTFERNKNTKLEGAFNEGKFNHNTNLNYYGNNGKGSFFDNTNLKMTGDYNEVSASHNKNLRIEGNKNDLTISGTRNHVLKPAPDGSSENVVRIVPDGHQSGFRGALWRSWFGNRNPSDVSVTYYIDYVKEATINSPEYNLGIFKFNMVRQDNQVQLTFDNSELDSGSYGVTESSSGKYTIAGAKNGERQTLSVMGPTVSSTHSGTNVFLVTW